MDQVPESLALVVTGSMASEIQDQHAPPSERDPNEPRVDLHKSIFNFDDSPLDLQSIEDWEKTYAPTGFQPKPRSQRPATSNPALVVDFYESCAKLGLRPVFTLFESPPYRFGGNVVFGEQVVELEGSFTSKKEAREQLCKAALPLLQTLIHAHDAKRGNTGDAQTKPTGRINKEDRTAEDWVSILTTHLQKQSFPFATYEEYRTETTPFYYATTVRFQSSPLQPFGSSDDWYVAKKDARKAAAREAVLWLRSQGTQHGGRSVPPTSRALVKYDASTSSTTAVGNELYLYQGVDVKHIYNLDVSLPQRVNELVASMGLKTLRFPVRALTSAVDSPVAMSVQFDERDVQKHPALSRVITVNNVYGRKKAKDMCCKEILQLFDEMTGRIGS